jgi:hypothetical protein
MAVERREDRLGAAVDLLRRDVARANPGQVVDGYCQIEGRRDGGRRLARRSRRQRRGGQTEQGTSGSKAERRAQIHARQLCKKLAVS